MAAAWQSFVRWAAAFFLASAFVTGAASAKPERIVTMSLCTDQIVLMLAAPERIASVHWLTRDADDSAMWEQARNHPANHGLAEEVVRLGPDLVIAGAYNAPLVLSTLRRFGFPILVVEDAVDFAGVRKNIRKIAHALEEETRGEAVISAFDSALAETQGALAERNMRGLVYGSGGYSAGAPSLFHEVLTHLGITNLAAASGSGSWMRMPVEDVVRARPDIVFLGEYRRDEPSQAANVLAHPALSRLAGRSRYMRIATNLWNCGTPILADAARTIIERLQKDAGGG